MSLELIMDDFFRAPNDAILALLPSRRNGARSLGNVRQDEDGRALRSGLRTIKYSEAEQWSARSRTSLLLTAIP
jgi:hypothetical protein